MAFLPFSYDDGQPLPFEYYKLSAGAGGASIQIGTGMALSSGKLSASAEPEYICMRTASAVADGTIIPVIHISPDVVFEAPLAASPSPTPAQTATCASWTWTAPRPATSVAAALSEEE